MRKLRLAVVLFVLTVGLTLAAGEPATSPAVQQLLEKMTAASAQAKNVEMDLAMSTRMGDQAVEAKGHARCHADGRRFIMEMESKTGGMTLQMRVVSDGQIMWSEVSAPGGQKMVQRWPTAMMDKMGGSNQNPLAAIKQMREQFAFTTVTDGPVGKEDVSILEGTVKPDFVERQLKAVEETGGAMAAAMAKAQLESMAKARVYVDKKDHLVRRTEMLDKKDQVVAAVQLENIRAGVPLDDAIFKYAPPAGVQVMDMAQMLKAARESTKTQAPPPPKAEDPKK
jgi:outer membrane lipoprotein-sorting protein